MTEEVQLVGRDCDGRSKTYNGGLNGWLGCGGKCDCGVMKRWKMMKDERFPTWEGM